MGKLRVNIMSFFPKTIEAATRGALFKGALFKGVLKRKMYYPFKWIQLNGNVKIG